MRALLSAFIISALALSAVSLQADDLRNKKGGGGSSRGSGGGSKGDGGGQNEDRSGGNRGGSRGGSGSSGDSRGSRRPTVQQPRSERTPRVTQSPSQTYTRQDLRGRVSRSGPVRYGSSNNRWETGRSRPVEITKFDTRSGSLGNQVLRESQTYRGNSYNDRYRNGYYRYDNRWNDDRFRYGYYGFNYSDQCVPSPWYYYSNLPAYLIITRISFDGRSFDSQYRDFYDWRRYDDDYSYGNRYRNEDLDRAIEQIVYAFERGDIGQVEELIPRNGQIEISVEGSRRYWVNSDDFYDMLSDAVESTRTLRYRIVDVRTGRDGAQVVAEHQYADAWGRRQSVYHRYVLRRDRYGYSIAGFGVTRYRP